MTPVIHFVAGLPRSGSTLLQNLLAQNPGHHVTPTNGLISMMGVVRDNWTKFDAFKAQGLQNVQPRIGAGLRAMSYGFYEEELSAGKVVFDKSRGWLQHIEMLEEVYRRPVRVVCTVRDLRAVAASFEKLHRKNPMGRRQHLGASYFAAQTIDGRARVLASPGGIFGLPVNYIRDAMSRGAADRVIVVRYQDLTSRPQETMDWLHGKLGLPGFEYDPNNVEQVTFEDDSVHGWGPDLHRIRSKVEPPAEAPWAGVLPEKTCQWLNEEFADIQGLVYSSPLGKPAEATVGSEPPGEE